MKLTYPKNIRFWDSRFTGPSINVGLAALMFWVWWRSGNPVNLFCSGYCAGMAVALGLYIYVRDKFNAAAGPRRHTVLAAGARIAPVCSNCDSVIGAGRFQCEDCARFFCSHCYEHHACT